MTEHKPKLLDLRGVLGPWALLKASAACRDMSRKDHLEILVGDADVKNSLLSILARAFCDVYSEATSHGVSGTFRIIARKLGAGGGRPISL